MEIGAAHVIAESDSEEEVQHPPTSSEVNAVTVTAESDSEDGGAEGGDEDANKDGAGVLETDDLPAELAGIPVLEQWQWTGDGAVCGYVYGKDGFRDGELMTTSVVPPDGRFETHVVTGSGSAYRLGEPAAERSGTRRSSRAVGKESLLDAFSEALNPVPGTALHYAVGGVDVGGVAAEKDHACLLFRAR